jgi:lysozyme
VNIEKLKAQLRLHEGFVSYVYEDNTPEKYLTIGIGRLVDQRIGGGITEDEALYLLEHDIAKAVGFVESYSWYAGLNDARQNALIEMAFNLGPNRFRGFKKMIAAIEAKDWKEAAAQALDSRWAVQVKNRALRLAEMIRSGEFP